MTARIVYITAVYGNYETTLKPIEPQTIKSDFLCFTDSSDIDAGDWTIDTTPYHIINKSPQDTGIENNSFSNNKHPFNIAKYYKQQFHHIPRLKSYDIIVWLDGTVEIYNPLTSEIIISRLLQSPIVGWSHEHRSGILEQEVIVSATGDKYTSTFWCNHPQPYQDVISQYEDYLRDGYSDTYWQPFRENNPNFGVWITCFVAFNMNDTRIPIFLDKWYLQTLKYTTQDQISFPYVCQSEQIIPYTFPDTEVKGDAPHKMTDLYFKHFHGR